ncbi:MAG: hypothetical protein HYZ57_09395 [Acidobacteria bacterium]|nr:hypothetical protein [Acidobacteriota bacterium]
MHRLVFFVLLLSAASSLGAQELVNITISADPLGPYFEVDGRQYNRPATFLWPKGSKHIVIVPVLNNLDPAAVGPCSQPGSSGSAVQYDFTCTTRYTFGGWSDNTGLLATGTAPAITVTADPKVTSLKATFSVEHKLALRFFDTGSTSTPATCAAPGDAAAVPTVRPGVVYVNGTCYWGNAEIWLTSGPLTLNAFPYPGFVFTGWNVLSGAGSSFLSTSNMSIHGGVTLTPIFAPGKRVTFLTEPRGLQVLIDRTPTPTSPNSPCSPAAILPPLPPSPQRGICPGEFDFAEGSKHVLGAPSPQTDSTGVSWIFDSWSAGGGQNTDYTAVAVNVPETITAKFVRGARIALQTVPNDLKLMVDGRDNWSSYNFIWGVGSKHAVAAPAEQVGRNGRRYAFKGWSNGGSTEQELTIEPSALESGLRLIATYDLLNRAVVQSNTPGVKLRVDGADCTSPCTVDKPAGTEVRISAPAVVPVSEVTRRDFIGWNDVASAERTITLDRDHQTVQALYRTAHKLMTAVDPAEGATLVVSPPSSDGFFPADSEVTLSVETRPGFKFRRWDGDVQGTWSQAVVLMAAPQVVRALLDTVPYIAPAGVKNAVYGDHLAPYYEVGPSSPLAQTIAGVSVLVADRILGLAFVSPQQINAILPSDLPEGPYTLTVQVAGQADITADFAIVRNAPGLFSNLVDSRAYAVALHEDGTPVAASSPAKKNEEVTLLGTGFGPYDRPVVEGFPVADRPVINLADALEISANDLRLQPLWSGPAPGFIGVSATRFRVPADLPAGLAELRVDVNGTSSNTVALPIE